LQIDIGFGDALSPAPRRIHFPSILGSDGPIVLCYSREHVVAEKFQATVELGRDNTRMKDFFDLWFLARNCEFEHVTLAEAVRVTFKQRNTDLPQDRPIAFSSDFLASHQKLVQWKAFLGRTGLQGAPTLQEAGELAWRLVEPCLYGENLPAASPRIWTPEVGWEMA